jgi:hypothetical protein
VEQDAAAVRLDGLAVEVEPHLAWHHGGPEIRWELGHGRTWDGYGLDVQRMRFRRLNMK